MSDNEEQPMKQENGPDQSKDRDVEASVAGAAGSDNFDDDGDVGGVPAAANETAGASNSTTSGGEASHVKIRIEFQDSVDVYKIKKDQSFKKLINKFCARHGVDYSVVRFIYDGKKIRLVDTPNTMGMEDEEETIEVFTEQSGGMVI